MKRLPIPNALWVTSGVVAFSATAAAIFNHLPPGTSVGLPDGLWWFAGAGWLVYGCTTPRRPLEQREFPESRARSGTAEEQSRARKERRASSRRRRRGPRWMTLPMFRRYGMRQPPED